MKVKRILITGTNTTLDNGETAISLTAIKNLKKILPNSRFIVGSTNKPVDEERWHKMLPEEGSGINVISGTNSLRVPRSIRAIFVILRYLPECLKADVCLDISGDGYSNTTQSGILSSITHSIQLLMGILLRKPVIVYAQSIGPFKNKLTRLLARFILNRVNLITVREDLTAKYLRKLGVNKPFLTVTGDSAFLMEPVSFEAAELALKNENVRIGDRILVGMPVSQVIHKWMFQECKNSAEKFDLYTDIMAKTADYLVDKLGAIVILTSQSIGAHARHDDRIAAVEIHRKAKLKGDVKVILGQYTPQELKGIIGCCSLVISSKMHSAIAATSMFIPTIVLAYSHKTHGIFGRKLGLGPLIVDVTELDQQKLLTELKSKIDYLLTFNDDIISNLRERIPIEKQNAIRNVDLVAELIDSIGRVRA